MNKTNFVNASFVLAGAACFLFVLSGYHSGGLIPIKGIWTLFPLALPLLGFWFGLFFRQVFSKPKWWVLVIVALAAVYILFRLATDHVCYKYTHTLRAMLPALVGFLIPAGKISSGESQLETSILLLLSLLAYVTCEFALDRVHVGHMAEGYKDMQEQLFNVLNWGIWAPTFLTVWLSTEFSFSKAGQWLGSRKWFRWIASIIMVIVFIGVLGRLFEWRLEWWKFLDFIFQPVTIYLGIVIYRLICNRISGKEIKKYDNVFKIW